jgi:asparagine synthase (glutamine-hydrolysing)
MCGLAGFIGRNLADRQSVLARMSRALEHRGPDAEGSYSAEFDDGRSQLAFAHRRLAIIDLGPAANQPMHSEDGRFSLIFNGEIYNYIELRDELTALGHRFSTGSDTEVLLKAYVQWRMGMLDRLSGMFAFALFDHQLSTLILARDPFGKKPLYVMESGGLLAFASEISALLSMQTDTPKIDAAAVHDYLLWRYVPGPTTLFKGIRKLAPGSYAIWSNGNLTESRYYTPPDQTDVTEDIDSRDAERRFLALLHRAVSLRMRSDAPFGAFLSGGLDSSAIVALMVEHASRPVRTFSVGFHESSYSELPFARSVAAHFQTDHTELVFDAHDMMTHLGSMVRHRGAPVSQSSDIPIYLMSKRASQDVKMVLTGEGADEILAGYPKHRAESLAGLYRACIPSSVHQRLIGPLLRAIPSGTGRLRTFARSAGERDFAARMTSWFGAANEEQVDALLGAKASRSGLGTDLPFSSDPSESPLRRTLFFDQTSWLPDNLLERGDRMMMAGSVEGRMPFLDRDLVSFVSRLPDRHRLGRRHGKQILRDVMADRLPKTVLNRRKVGFTVPVAHWFRGAMKDYVGEHLSSSQSVVRSYLDNKAIDRTIAEHMRGDANHEKQIWALLNLEIFHREFAVAPPA